MFGIWVGASVVLVLAAAVAAVWGYRAVSAWRLNAAADAYAERELARSQRR